MMGKIKLRAALFTLICLLATQVWSATFKGYQKPKDALTLVLKDSVWKFDESDRNFLVLLKHHDSFYRFPKQKETASLVRSFLQKSIKDASILSFTIDPIKAQIYEITQTHP